MAFGQPANIAALSVTGGFESRLFTIGIVVKTPPPPRNAQAGGKSKRVLGRRTRGSSAESLAKGDTRSVTQTMAGRWARGPSFSGRADFEPSGILSRVPPGWLELGYVG